MVSMSGITDEKPKVLDDIERTKHMLEELGEIGYDGVFQMSSKDMFSLMNRAQGIIKALPYVPVIAGGAGEEKGKITCYEIFYGLIPDMDMELTIRLNTDGTSQARWTSTTDKYTDEQVIGMLRED